MKKIMVAIPAYRCAEQLPRVLQAFSRSLLARVDRVCIFDNCSPDQTAEIARQTIVGLNSSQFELWQNTGNYGLGGTHKVAFHEAKRSGADYLAILHGDNQGRTEELETLIDAAEQYPEASAILGARFLPQSQLEGYSFVRTAGNLGLNCLYTLFGGRITWDMGSGLNLFRVDRLPYPELWQFTDGFTFNMELLLAYYRRKAVLKFVPISWSETDQRSNASALKVGWAALTTLLRWRLGAKASLAAAAKPQHYHSNCTYQLEPLPLKAKR